MNRDENQQQAKQHNYLQNQQSQTKHSAMINNMLLHVHGCSRSDLKGMTQPLQEDINMQTVQYLNS